MTRKQFYLTSHLDNALKARAAKEGVSEAEIVRGALEQVLLEHMPKSPQGQAMKALKRLIERAHASRQTVIIPKDWVFDRDALYDRSDRADAALDKNAVR